MDRARQFRQLDRLVQLGAVLPGNLLQGPGRDIAGEDDHGNSLAQQLAHRVGHLKPIETERQIIVGQHQSRMDHPAADQVDGRHPVGNRCDVVPFVLKDQRQELADLGIVLDQQHRPSDRGEDGWCPVA